MLNKSALPPGHTKHPLVHHLPWNYHHYTVEKIKRVKSEIDGQSSSLHESSGLQDSLYLDVLIITT